METKYGIARHINGVTINPYEFILNNKNDVMEFNSVEDCIKFMYENTDEERTESQWADDGIHFVQL